MLRTTGSKYMAPYLNEEMANSTRPSSPSWSFGGDGIDRSLTDGKGKVSFEIIILLNRHPDLECIITKKSKIV